MPKMSEAQSFIVFLKFQAEQSEKQFRTNLELQNHLITCSLEPIKYLPRTYGTESDKREGLENLRNISQCDTDVEQVYRKRLNEAAFLY